MGGGRGVGGGGGFCLSFIVFEERNILSFFVLKSNYKQIHHHFPVFYRFYVNTFNVVPHVAYVTTY